MGLTATGHGSRDIGEVRSEDREQVRRLVRADSSPKKAILELLRFGADRLGVEQGLLTRIKPGPGTVQVVEHTGTVPKALAGTLDLSNTFCRRVIAGGNVFGVHDAGEEGQSTDPAYEIHGLQCYIGEKVLVDEELYGTACFIKTIPRDKPFTEAEIALVRLLACCIGHHLGDHETDEAHPSRARLQQDRALLRRVEKVAEVGGWKIDLDTQRLVWTQEVYRIHEVPFEYRPSVDEGIQFYAPEARPRLREALNQCINDGIPYDLELPFDTARGTRRWVRARGRRITDENGTPAAVVGTVQDVTERRILRERFREHRNLLQSINENLSEGIYRSRPPFGLVYVNQAMVDLFGYETAEEMKELDPRALYANPERRKELWADDQKEQSTLEVEFRREDGSTFPGRVGRTVGREKDWAATRAAREKTERPSRER